MSGRLILFRLLYVWDRRNEDGGVGKLSTQNHMKGNMKGNGSVLEGREDGYDPKKTYPDAGY